MIANILGTDGIIVLIVALVVLFGGSQLPKLAKNVGSAGREFRKAQAEADEEARQHDSRTELSAAPAPAAPVAADEDKLVISRSDLRQELSNLLDQRQDHAEH